MNMTINEWRDLVDRINKDDSDGFVPLTDHAYWANQIFNLMEEKDWFEAYRIAEAISHD